MVVSIILIPFHDLVGSWLAYFEGPTEDAGLVQIFLAFIDSKKLRTNT